MKARQPLRQRIVFAFVLMALLVSGAFSIGIVQIVHMVEEHLLSAGLQSELEAAMDALGTGRTYVTEKNVTLYTNATPALMPPPEFAQVNTGFSEVVLGELAYYVYRINSDGFAYMLVEDQREFEAREQLLFDTVLVCFVISILLAWGLGELLANRVMQPVVQLAEEVRSGGRVHQGQTAVGRYADDEVGRLAEVFDSTFEQLQHSLEREQLFTSDVSHELRTPLMVIASSCELLEQSPGLGDKQQSQLARIRRASENMLELVKTLLLLARERGESGEEVHTISLAEAAQEQSNIWAEQFAARGIDYQCEMAAPDEGRYQSTFLHTVISNLLRNALHYTDRGYVRFVVFHGGFRVEDSGPGIAPEQYADVFRPFQRGSLARGEGLGLGLSLVKRICDHQGWSISILPAQPHGCIFEVILGTG